MQTKVLWQALKRHHIEQTVKPLWAQISPLLEPLTEPAQDIRYHDLFLAMKAELEKTSNIDLEMVDQAGRDLCVQVAKDIRVAVYLSYVWLRQDAYQGLMRGLLLLYAFCIVYADSYQPRRAPLVKTMLSWLAGEKMENACMLLQGRLLAEEYQAIEQLCQLIQTQLTEQFQQPFTELNALLALLPTDEMRRHEADRPDVSSADTAAVTPATAPAVAATATVAEGLPVKTVLRSSQEVLDTMRTVGRFITEQEMNEWAAARLLRVFRWDLLRQLPPHEQGITRIMPPRAVLLTQLEQLYAQQNWIGLWQSCQQAFMEASNHFCFDLQYLSWCAMQHLDAEALQWADVLSSDMALLLMRLPQLDSLSFSDGRVFASEETRQWIEVHARFQPADIQQAMTGQQAQPLLPEDLEQQAMTMLHEHNMAKALAWLQGVTLEDDGVSQMRKHYLMAKLAIEAGQLDFAQALLEKLNNTLSAEPLFSWDKQWTFLIKKMLWQILQRPAKNKSKSQDNGLQMALLAQEMTVLDPYRAHQLLYK